MADRRESAKAFAVELSRTLAGRSPADRRMLFVGVLNRYLPKNRPAVLVGGAAVEFYTQGAYTTGDVDLVGVREFVLPLLEAAGFVREGRVFVQADLGVVADLAGLLLRRGTTVRTVEFEGYSVPVVSVEDAIVDRLLAASAWRSPPDWEQAALLFATNRDMIDMEALEAKARANDVAKELRDLVERTERSLE